MITKLLPSIVIYLIPIILCAYNIKKKDNRIHYFVITYFFAISAIRWHVGDDFVGYLQLIKLQTDFSILSIEPLEKLLFYLSNSYRNFYIFFGINALILSLVLTILGKQYPKIKEGLLFVYLLLFGPMSFSFVRAITGLTISLLGNKYLMDRKYIKFTLIILLGSLFHISMLTLLILPVILEIMHILKKNKVKTNIIIIGSIVISVPYMIKALYSVLNELSLSKYAGYLKNIVNTIDDKVIMVQLIMLITIGIIYTFYLLLKRNNIGEDKTHTFSLIMGASSLLLVFIVLFIFGDRNSPRLLMNFGFFAVFGIAYTIYKPSKILKLLVFLPFISFLSVSVMALKIFPYNINQNINWISRENLMVKLELVTRYNFKESQDYLKSTRGPIRTSLLIDNGSTYCEKYYKGKELQWCLISFDGSFGYKDIKYSEDYKFLKYKDFKDPVDDFFQKEETKKEVVINY